MAGPAPTSPHSPAGLRARSLLLYLTAPGDEGVWGRGGLEVADWWESCQHCFAWSGFLPWTLFSTIRNSIRTSP